MIYEQPKISPAGDCFIMAEFGDDGAIELNFMALSLMRLINEGNIDGIIDTTPAYNSLLIEYEPDHISTMDLTNELHSLFKSLGSIEDIEIESRLAYLPCCYLDPWTQEAIEDYCQKVTKREYDPDFVARLNGLEDRHQLVRIHSGSEHWVASVMALPGCALMRPLDPRCLLTSPKYNPPRLWTPENAVCTGGMSTSIHTLRVPGGYNLIGRTPVPVYEAAQTSSVFKSQVTLLQPGDRVKFLPIDTKEYRYIREEIKNGTYSFRTTDYIKFSVRDWKHWVSTLNIEERF
ncbi:MAG: transporter [Gammaproteobacteria bacterium]|nr:transporter [Gammaproteobacteria bacterium]